MLEAMQNNVMLITLSYINVLRSSLLSRLYFKNTNVCSVAPFSQIPYFKYPKTKPLIKLRYGSAGGDEKKKILLPY